MPLMSGTRLGPYEISALLAAGGPPPLALVLSELERRRGRAVAKLRRRS